MLEKDKKLITCFLYKESMSFFNEVVAQVGCINVCGPDNGDVGILLKMVRVFKCFLNRDIKLYISAEYEEGNSISVHAHAWSTPGWYWKSGPTLIL